MWIEIYKTLAEKPNTIKAEILKECKMKEQRFNNILYGRVKATDLELWIINTILKKHDLI
jgi:hypothetical protein